jgi:hexosaminidase
MNGNKFYNGRDWCAWAGEKVTIDVVLEEISEVDTIIIGTLSGPLSWIYPPESIEITASEDGDKFQTVASWSYKPLAAGRHEIILTIPATRLKHLRFNVQPFISIPEGKPGAGSPAWSFIDEIRVF